MRQCVAICFFLLALASPQCGQGFTLQILHASDWEACIPALEDAPRFSAVVEGLKAQYPSNTVVLSSGDNYILGPFMNASADPAGLRRVMDEFLLPHAEELRVICYLRPHAARVLSSFAEQMKLGLFDGTPEEFHLRSLKQRRFLYAEKLTAPFTEEQKHALRAEIALADDYAKSVGQAVCAAVRQHRGHIEHAVGQFVEPHIAEMMADLERELNAPDWPDNSLFG